MLIELKTTTFEQVREGEVFEYMGEHWIKIARQIGDCENAIRLKDGVRGLCFHSDPVISYPNAKIYLHGVENDL